jgi:hypothetical protein
MAYEMKEVNGVMVFVETEKGKSGKKSDGTIPAYVGLYSWSKVTQEAVENEAVKLGVPQSTIEKLRVDTDSTDETVRRSARGQRTAIVNSFVDNLIAKALKPAPFVPVVPVVDKPAKK